MKISEKLELPCGAVIKNRFLKSAMTEGLSSEDAVANSKKDLKLLVKDSQTPKGLNEQGVKELTKAGFYKSLKKTLNSIHKRLSK